MPVYIDQTGKLIVLNGIVANIKIPFDTTLDLNGFFAVGDNGVILRGSSDTWNKSASLSFDVKSIACSPYIMLAIGDHKIARSYNGWSWQEIDSPTTETLVSIGYLTGYDQGFILMCENKDTYLSDELTGLNWVKKSTIQKPGMTHMLAGASRVLMASNTGKLYSNNGAGDGVETNQTNMGTYIGEISTIYFDSFFSSNPYIVCDKTGKLFAGTGQIWYYGWENLFNNGYITSVLTNSTKMIVSGINDGSAYTKMCDRSKIGQSVAWYTDIDNPLGSNITRCMTSDNSIHFAVGDNGAIAASNNDGSIWTSVSSPVNSKLNQVIFGS